MHGVLSARLPTHQQRALDLNIDDCESPWELNSGPLEFPTLQSLPSYFNKIDVSTTVKFRSLFLPCFLNRLMLYQSESKSEECEGPL